MKPTNMKNENTERLEDDSRIYTLDECRNIMDERITECHEYGGMLAFEHTYEEGVKCYLFHLAGGTMVVAEEVYEYALQQGKRYKVAVIYIP